MTEKVEGKVHLLTPKQTKRIAEVIGKWSDRRALLAHLEFQHQRAGDAEWEVSDSEAIGILREVQHMLRVPAKAVTHCEFCDEKGDN